MERLLFGKHSPLHGLEGLPRELWLQALAFFVNFMGGTALAFLVLYQTERLGRTPSQAGWGLVAFGLGALAGTLCSGRLSDRWGPLKVERLSLIGAGLFMLLLPFMRDPRAFLLVVALWAVFNAGFHPAAMSHLADAAPEGRGQTVMALGRVAGNLGLAIGPLVGGLLATRSYLALFWLDGLTSLAAFAVLLAIPARAHARKTAAEGPSALQDPRLRALLVSGFLACLVLMQHLGVLPLFVVDRLGRSKAFFGSIFTLNTLMIGAFEVRLNLATARWSPARTLGWGAAFIGAGFALTGLAHSTLALYAATAVWTLGEMALFPSLSHHIAVSAPEGRLGEAMGYYAMTWSLAFVMGPALGVAAFERPGPASVWIGCLAVGLLAAAGFSRVRAGEPR